MMRDVIRFNKEAPELLRLDPTDPQRTQTMGQYCDANEYRYVNFAPLLSFICCGTRFRCNPSGLPPSAHPIAARVSAVCF